MPSIDRHQRLRAVFDEVVQLDPYDREAFLERTCSDDPDLRAHVQRLLAVHKEADSFLEQPLGLLSAGGDQAPFAGTDRFRIVRRLGAGGMGVVYEVHDALRNERVALKTLRRTGASDLYRLKQEFRSLADVTHPNLVCLYELFVDDAQSFFTMELVRGVSFVEYARGTDGSQLLVDRLTDTLRQLIDGVSAIHRRGKLHRDIKPSNVLVTSAGRVVILDFGLIAELLPQRAGEPARVSGGTPAYMSPEEAAGGAASESSDWYGVGVTLYESLTGTVPFDGAVSDVLARKGTLDPPPPSAIAPHGVPQSLDGICMGLLQRDPERRLRGPDALRVLVRDDSRPDVDAPTAQGRDRLFVGRGEQLQALHEAHAAAARGKSMAAAVHGPSGIGKSALVRNFLGSLAGRDDAVTLAGRCYENESVPYKALDGLIDDLSRYLTSIASHDARALLPPDVTALVRVFPVLRRVEVVAAAVTDDDLESVDPLRVRRRAFEALKALLGGLAARRLLVVWIDDLQWADADSIVLLEELLNPPDAPAMLTLLSFRSEELAAKPFLQALIDRADRDRWVAVALGPLTDDEARVLFGGLLPGENLSEHDRSRMTREAGGSPFVLEQLALYAAADRGATGQPRTFAGVFETRLRALSDEARRFLETLALCGRPMAPDVVCDANAIASDRQSLVVRLRSAHLIRSSGSSARVETYHDRIREVLAGRVDAEEACRIHRRMADALVARGSDDCEALFEHYRGAGDSARATIQAELAAGKASAALAFDRAASFYSQALDLSPASPTRHVWSEALATALANAGRPAEAADAYLRAAPLAVRARQAELRRRAAEQFLIGGHIDRGLDLIRSVLESVGLGYARSPRTAMLWILWRRARLRWRGLQFEARRAEDVNPEALLRLDTCWAAASGLGLVDLVTASAFIAEHLHLSLDVGEPSRIARGLALESAARHADWPFRKGGRRLARLASAHAASVGTPHARATELLADGVSATNLGEWSRALRSSEEASAILRDRCVGLTWELNMAQNVVIWALMYLGEIAEVCRRVPALLADARRRGNLYLATELCTRCNYVWLAADDPDGGEREVVAAVAQWSRKGFHRQHYSARLARVQTALYRGDGAAAWRLVGEQESDLRRSMLTRVQAIRIESLYLKGRSALADTCARPGAGSGLSVARACADRIAAERMPWSDPIALLLHAGIDAAEGRDSVLARLHNAAERFDRAGMKLYAAVARRRIGALRADEHGRTLRQQADTWMATQQIKNPAAFTRMLAPGFRE